MNKEQELKNIKSLLDELFPIHRSIAGPGLRKSVSILSSRYNLESVEYPSGVNCFGWTIPNEWEVHDAWIKDGRGVKILSLSDSNLHLVAHSGSVDTHLSGKELKNHLHSYPKDPRAIPYVTSYYTKAWGFCLSEEQLQVIQDDEIYHAYINADLYQGYMSGAKAKCLPINGRMPRSYLVSSYLCHPSMANDNLSGPILACLLWERIKLLPNLNNNWYLQIAPETIGALAWLKENIDIAKKLDGAFVCTTCAGPGQMGYKDAFDQTTLISKAVRLAFRDLEIEPLHYPFIPDGSDERQFSSPGLRVPCVTITKDKYYEYDTYHTSADDLQFITPSNLLASLEVYWQAVVYLENNTVFRRNSLVGETRLGPYGLYPEISGHVNQSSTDKQLAALAWVDWAGDATIDLVDLAFKSGLSFMELKDAADKLEKAGVGSQEFK